MVLAQHCPVRISTEGTLVVKPPRSGDFKICFNVFTNLSSVCNTVQHTALSENILKSRDTTHRRAEKHQWHNQHRRVEDILIFIALAKELLLLVVRVVHNLLVQLISGQLPHLFAGAGEGALLCEPEACRTVRSTVMCSWSGSHLCRLQPYEKKVHRVDKRS